MDSESSSDGLSIVIPTYNSSVFLAKLLETVETSHPSGHSLEVLIVDDSTQDEAEATQALCRKYGTRYLCCRGNVARKRNYGTANASQPIVLFTDSDCELTPTVLSEHLKLGATGPEIGAMVGLVEFAGPVNWVWSVVERTAFLGAYSFARRMPYAPWGVTANLSVKRTVLGETGGFDETFLQAPGGEDVELGLRINKAGYKIACNPDAVVYHTRATWNSLGRMLRRVFGYGRAHYHVITKHLDRVGLEYPRLGAVFLLMCLLSTLKTALTCQWLPVVGCAVSVLVVMVAQASFVLRSERRSLRELPREMVAHGLDLTFEYGLLYESLRHHDLHGFWSKMIYGERQLLGERPRRVAQAWSLLAGLLVILLFS